MFVSVEEHKRQCVESMLMPYQESMLTFMYAQQERYTMSDRMTWILPKIWWPYDWSKEGVVGVVFGLDVVLADVDGPMLAVSAVRKEE